MNSIAGTIKRLRTDAQMTQDDLAAQMHVTRQTVSNWENDRNQPDIDTLTALADLFGTDINELIYGNERGEYPRFQKRCIRTAALALVCMLALIAFRLTAIPYMTEVIHETFTGVFEMLLVRIESMALLCLCLGILIPAVFSLWADCSVRGSRLYWIAACLLVLPALIAAGEYICWKFFDPSCQMFLLWGTVERPWTYPLITQILPGLSGVMLFLNGNKKDPKE